MERNVRVELGDRSYDIRIGAGSLDVLGQTVAALPKVSSAVVISDATVAGCYGRRAVDSVSAAGLAASMIHFPAGEKHKNLVTFSCLLDELFALRPAVDRNTVIVALGGGVPGDVAGFVAASALRGMRFVQCPTSLLADVDSSVGGKTGIDHAAGKNLIGAFHQPRGVVIDVETLATLSDDELRNGLAECVKHGVIRDETLLTFIEDRVEAIFARDAATLTELIARNVEIKAAVVSADEREAGQRAHLNFGHTIGHAIEAFAGYDELPHGRAVSLGMIAANHLAATRGLIGCADAARIEATLVKLALPVRRTGLDVDEIWRIMQHDKKALAGRVRMILPTRLGAVEVFDDIDPREVAAAVRALDES